jgi:hypothetical protein
VYYYYAFIQPVGVDGLHMFGAFSYANRPNQKMENFILEIRSCRSEKSKLAVEP